MYLDYAEDQAKRRAPMTMAQWSERLDAFLTFNERELLIHPGKVSAAIAKELSESRYDQFNAERQRQNALAADEFDYLSLLAIEQDSENK